MPPCRSNVTTRTLFQQTTNRAIIIQYQPLLKSLFHTSRRHSVTQVKLLPSWNISTFRNEAFDPSIPAKLPYTKENLPPACTKWFIHDKPALLKDDDDDDDAISDNRSDNDHNQTTSKIQPTFWSDYKDTLVPLELTSTPNPAHETNEPSSSSSSQHEPLQPEFQRITAPLDLLLTHLSLSSSSSTTTTTNPQRTSIYLAQCPLPTLPQPLQNDLPTPSLVLHTGKGDIYTSSLWLGRAPTYTPLHRDPNPNVLLQLAGHKIVRLFPPETGDALYEYVHEELLPRTGLSGADDSGVSGGGVNRRFRGEEMMQGTEKKVLMDLVWGNEGTGESAEGDGSARGTSQISEKYAIEARLRMGEALFIPKGWWHSVRGVGRGVSASVNWWFR